MIRSRTGGIGNIVACVKPLYIGIGLCADYGGVKMRYATPSRRL